MLPPNTVPGSPKFNSATHLTNRVYAILSETRYIFAKPDNGEEQKKWFHAMLVASSDWSLLPNEFKQALKVRLYELSDSRLFINLDISEINLTGCDLSHLNLSQANLTGVVLNRANLSRTMLTQANLTNAQVIKANVFRTDFRSANLPGTNFDGTDTTLAYMPEKDTERTSNLFEADFPGASDPAKTNEIPSFILNFLSNTHARL